MKYSIFFMMLALLTACSTQEPRDPFAVPDTIDPTVLNSVPEWAKEAVWYQIFVERFRDGDSNNQPTLEGIKGSWPHGKPENWAPSRWTQDWYTREGWEKEVGGDFYHVVQMRRYGGDLQGVLDKLDYLADLGINAIYFNPLNDSPSLHKYDARNYHHIDIFFGADPAGDLELMNQEDPANPDTWVWTSADKMFLKVIEEAKKRGIRVVLDYSWNHTGITFWAWQDVVKNQQASRFADWYRIDSFDDPEKGTEFSFTGWAGVAELPEFRHYGEGAGEIMHGQIPKGDLHPDLKRHIFAVTRRWMDPTGTGDLSKGVDGFRLDVAELIPGDFWRDYRKFVRSINPEALLVGELWWELWPEKMLDPAPWLQGDIFDSAMNYRWYMPSRSFFGKALPKVETPSEFVAHQDSVRSGVRREVNLVQMNLTASHDTPRFATSMLNKGRYKYQVNPRENRSYKLTSPDAITLDQMHLLLVHQFTWIGAPHIWMGDEMGMWGADDPDVRKPLVWPDLQFDPEATHPFGQRKLPEVVSFNTSIFERYRSLIRLRTENEVFVHGSLNITITDDTNNLLSYTRVLGDKQAIVIFNNADKSGIVRHPLPEGKSWEVVYTTHPVSPEFGPEDMRLEMAARSATVLLSMD